MLTCSPCRGCPRYSSWSRYWWSNITGYVWVTRYSLISFTDTRLSFISWCGTITSPEMLHRTSFTRVRAVGVWLPRSPLSMHRAGVFRVTTYDFNRLADALVSAIIRGGTIAQPRSLLCTTSTWMRALCIIAPRSPLSMYCQKGRKIFYYIIITQSRQLIL